MSQAPRRGWLAGHSVLELGIVLLIAFGLSAGLARPGIQTAIALLGGLLLAWMGGKMIWDAWQGAIRLPGQAIDHEQMSTRQLVGLGMIATISALIGIQPAR